jgi:outer membrane immunogenic protein
LDFIGQGGIMKKLILVIVASAAFVAPIAAPTFAADMPVKAPVVAAVDNWAGFYIGAHLGRGWADNRFFEVAAGSDAASFTATDILGGGQVGFNWQSGPWILGVEADGILSHLRRGVTFLRRPIAVVGGCGCACDGGGGCGGGARVEQLGLLSGRAGYARDNWLVYVKGGVALAHDKYVFNAPGIINVITDDTRVGWTVSSGLEWGLTPNCSVKVEYNYVDLGTKRVTFAAVGSPTFVFDLDQQVQIVKFGINYRFGGTAVVANY